MPYATRQHLADLTNCLVNGTYQQKLKALQRTPISPPDGSLHGVNMSAKSQQVNWGMVRIADVEQMVGYLKLLPAVGEKEGGVTFDIKRPAELTTAKLRQAYTIPAWWLPWQRLRIVRLKIQDVAANNGQIALTGGGTMPNPDLFFTAALSGCSVFADGPTAAPRLYHGGFEKTSAIPSVPLAGPGDTTEAFWFRQLNKPTARGIGKSDYVKELKPNATSDADRFESTRRAAALEARLRSTGDYVEFTHDAITLSPWGAVFGLRDGAGNWVFELVKNASANFFRRHSVIDRVEVPSRVPFRGPQTLHVPRNVFTGVSRRTVTLRDDGQGERVVVAETNISRTSIGMCVTLGHKQFFPGVGRTQYVALGSRRIMDKFG